MENQIQITAITLASKNEEVINDLVKEFKVNNLDSKNLVKKNFQGKEKEFAIFAKNEAADFLFKNLQNFILKGKKSEIDLLNVKIEIKTYSFLKPFIFEDLKNDVINKQEIWEFLPRSNFPLAFALQNKDIRESIQIEEILMDEIGPHTYITYQPAISSLEAVYYFINELGWEASLSFIKDALLIRTVSQFSKKLPFFKALKKEIKKLKF